MYWPAQKYRKKVSCVSKMLSSRRSRAKRSHILTIFIRHLHMENEELEVLLTAWLDESLQDPFKSMATANGGLGVTFTWLANCDHQLRGRKAGSWSLLLCHLSTFQSEQVPAKIGRTVWVLNVLLEQIRYLILFNYMPHKARGDLSTQVWWHW